MTRPKQGNNVLAEIGKLACLGLLVACYAAIVILSRIHIRIWYSESNALVERKGKYVVIRGGRYLPQQLGEIVSLGRTIEKITKAIEKDNKP